MMKCNLAVLGWILVLGGCDAEMSDLSKTLPDAGTFTDAGSATKTAASTTTTSTKTSTTSSTSTSTGTPATTSTSTDTSTGTTTSTEAIHTWTWTVATNQIQTTTVVGYGYNTTLGASLFTQTVTYTGVDIPTATRTVSQSGSTGIVTVSVDSTQTAISTKTFVRPIDNGTLDAANPCFYGNSACYRLVNRSYIATCGWESAANKCYSSPWCEPSVASVGQNGIQPGLPTMVPVQQRPASAKCAAGQKTYTYNPGELLLWGDMVISSSYAIGQAPNDGYLCVPNAQFITINC